MLAFLPPLGNVDTWAALKYPVFPQVLSITALSSSYRFWAKYFEKERQRAWIITTLAAFAMTAMALPFLFDYLRAGGSLRGLQPRSDYARMMGKLFQGYLITDLTVGAIHYPSQVSWATGWGHHIVYVGIVEFAIRNSLAHLFSLCLIMELPTFLLGLSTLYPRFRSNVLFALTFLLTRIMFHIAVLLSCYRHSTIFSMAPVWILTAVFPLHVSWFVGCLQGFVRRRRQARAVAVISSNSAPTATHSEPPRDVREVDSANTASISIDIPKVSATFPRRRLPLYILRTTNTRSLRLPAAQTRQRAYTFLGIGRDSLDRRYKYRTLTPAGIEEAEGLVRAGVVY